MFLYYIRLRYKNSFFLVIQLILDFFDIQTICDRKSIEVRSSDLISQATTLNMTQSPKIFRSIPTFLLSTIFSLERAFKSSFSLLTKIWDMPKMYSHQI